MKNQVVYTVRSYSSLLETIERKTNPIYLSQIQQYLSEFKRMDFFGITMTLTLTDDFSLFLNTINNITICQGISELTRPTSYSLIHVACQVESQKAYMTIYYAPCKEDV